MRSVFLRVLVAGLVAMLAAVGMAACGGDDDEGDTEALETEFPAPTSPPEDAQEGGTLEVISSGDVDYLDPGAAYYQYTYMFDSAMHRTLMNWPPAETEEPVPDLAEDEPEISEDNRTITFTLRDGVRFSPPVDREVTSADVKYALERALLPGVANGYAPSYLTDITGFEDAQKAAEEDDTVAPDISGITTPDDRTLVIRLDVPEVAIADTVVQVLSLPISAPVPEEYAKEFDAESPSTYGTHVVATGPYMVENNEEGELTGYEPGKSIHFVRNPNWDPETDERPAYLDEIEVRAGFTDVTSASRRILEGDSQVSGDIVPTPAALKLAAQEFPEGLTLTPSGNRYVSLNTTIPPFDDINVRKAVIAAADREALRLARGGELIGEIATHFLPPEFPGFEDAGGVEGTGLDFLAEPTGDPELAAEYFRKAGYESGTYEGDEELLMVGENAGVDQKVAEVALELFESLGFNINFRQVDSDVMYTKFCNVPRNEIAICPNVGWLPDFRDGQAMLDATFNGEGIVPTNNSNWPELDVPEINDAIAEARLIDDPEERDEAWGEIDTMITEQAPAIPYIWDNFPNINSANVNVVINKFNANTDLSYTSLQP
jgi:peptide/nickel transport system substrate-binding protein